MIAAGGGWEFWHFSLASIFISDQRVLVGVGALLAAGLIVMQAALQQWRRSDKWTLSLAGMLALGMCSLASAYGNALEGQKNYEDRIAARLADDLAEFKVSHSINSFLLDGSVGYAPIAAHIAEQIPLIHTLVPLYISADDMFHTHIFLMYYMSSDLDDMRLKTDANATQLAAMLLAKACQLPATRCASAYCLRVIDTTAVVTFGSAYPQRCAAGNPSVGDASKNIPPMSAE